VGKPKAEVVCEFLTEMNPDVKGNAIVMSVKDFIDN
jgi:molybdopterin/thiamine biosynthesis adenylyltransferase